MYFIKSFMTILISIILALIITFSNPQVPQNFKYISTSQIKIIKGFPYEYFDGEILTNEVVEFRIRLIYIYFMTCITVTFSVGPIVSQTVFSPTLASIKVVIPNEEDFLKEIKLVSVKTNDNFEPKTKTRLGKN